jgi:alpha-tubulin suppressor-like RCC1 family protein
VPVLELTGVASISSRVDHNIARLSDGTVWSWGRNIYNQLGVPYVTESDVPVVISR